VFLALPIDLKKNVPSQRELVRWLPEFKPHAFNTCVSHKDIMLGSLKKRHNVRRRCFEDIMLRGNILLDNETSMMIC
jgi:hypothetical protein